MQITIIGGSGFVGTRLTKRLLEAGHTVKIADKRKSVTYLELWLRCDVRNSGNETKEFPASLTVDAMAPGADKIAKEAQPMHSLLEVLKGSDVVINLSAKHRDDVITPKSLYDEVNVQGSENICRACSELGIHRIIFTSLLPFTVLPRLELTKVEKSNISTITDARNFLQKKNIANGLKQILQIA